MLSCAKRGEMSEETDRYYGEGYESGAQDLHKWMRRAENAEARVHELEATIRKEINQRLLGIAAAIEVTMDNSNVDLYTPSQVLALIVNSIKWAPPRTEDK